MGRKFDLIVFDWDGTLFDSTATIVGALQAACVDLGQPCPDEQCASHVIGLGLADALRHVAPGLPEAEIPSLVDRYRHHYLAVDEHIRLFDGAAELIAALHAEGYMLAVATGKSRKGLDRALDNSGLRSYFQATRCADECFSKPHPQMLLELMEQLGVSPERTLMIGDTTHDLQMALNAGVAALAVECGAHPVAALQALNPLASLKEVKELTRWLDAQACGGLMTTARG